MSRYRGSCHCGGVRFEIDTNERLDPFFRCDCSLCARKGTVIGEAARKDLRVTQGEDLLGTHVWSTGEARHHFCKVCGIHTHHVMRGHTDRIGVNMACIEGVDVYAVGEVAVGGGTGLSLIGPAPGHARPAPQPATETAMATSDQFPEQITTERLLIRPAKPGDGPAFNAAIVESHAELRPWLGWADPIPSVADSERECRSAYGCCLLGEDLMVFFFRKADGVLVGGGGLHKADWKLRKFNVGYWCRTGCGGAGLITEAVVALSNHALEQLQANRLELQTDERNVRSQRLAERAGFSLEGVHRRAALDVAGVPCDLRIYARTAA